MCADCDLEISMDETRIQCDACKCIMHNYDCRKRTLKKLKARESMICWKCVNIQPAHVFAALKIFSDTCLNRFAAVEKSADFSADKIKCITNKLHILDALYEDGQNIGLKLDTMSNLLDSYNQTATETLNAVSMIQRKVTTAVESILSLSSIIEDADTSTTHHPSKNNSLEKELKTICQHISKLEASITSTTEKLKVTSSSLANVVEQHSLQISKYTADTTLGHMHHKESSSSSSSPHLNINVPVVELGGIEQLTTPTLPSERPSENPLIGDVLPPIVPVMRRRWIFLSRLDSSVTDESVKHHLVNNLKISGANPVRFPTKIINGKACEYVSYKISIPEDQLQTAINPDRWPQGLVIQELNWRPKHQNFRLPRLEFPNT